MRKLPARKLLVAIVAGALFLPNTAFTLGLGEIEVNSSLNQKLKADIELLSATEENSESIIVKLASRKEFTRAGLDRPYQLNDLRFKSEITDGVPHISVTSGSPIREPFLNFLVEIDWPNGHLIREYTILLDPPAFMTQPASVASAPAQSDGSSRPSSGGSTNIVPVVTPGTTAAPRPAATSVAPAPQPAAAPVNPAFVPAPYVQQQTSINQPPGSYRIKTGDTAWSLANAMMPDQSITVEQMMIAMLRANPESFIDENINGLKRGYILRVPDYDQIVSIDQEDARALVREQAALWRQYQQTHAGGQPASAMSTDEMGGAGYTEDGAVITGEEDDAYLEIVSAGAGSSTLSSKDPTQMTSQELRAELAFARERVETERVEKEALQQRVDNLEQNVGKMKGMLSIEDDELSGMQTLAEPSEGEMLEADIVEDAAVEMDESIAETDDMLAEQNLDDAITEETDAAEEAAEGAAEEAADTDEAAIYLDETSAEDESADMSESTDSMQDEMAADDVTQQPQIVTQPPADPLGKLLSDPILLAAAGGGLLLILAVIGLIIKKRRDSATETEPFDLASDDSLDSLADEVAAENAEDEVEVGSLAGDADQIDEDAEKTAIEDFDSDSTMILDAAEDTIIAEEDPDVVADDDEPRDDVIAEADVYLAYGIYQQAEELLTQAITDNPERDDYRVKLAETHYASKNAEAFVEVATEIKKRAGDDVTPSWKKVMVMGQDLCADNELFQGSMVGGLDVDALAPKTPEMDFDLGMDDDSGASPDTDSSLDDQPLELPDMDESSDGEDASAEEIGFDLSDAGAEEEASAEPDGGIEFDLSDTGAVDEAPAAAEDEFSLDIDAGELDIDMKDEADESVVSENDEVHDAGDIDIDFGLDDATSASADGAASDEEVAIDLTDEAESLDFDLDDSSTATEEVAEEAAPAPAADDDDDDFDLSSLDDVDEVSTKLDLARAYLDMGDNEGTRGILEEVIAEGNDEQKQEANELMAKLS